MMDIETAKKNIGQPFVVTEIKTKFDTIRSVTPEGIIIGDFLEADARDCRLKLPQPEHLKKKH